MTEKKPQSLFEKLSNVDVSKHTYKKPANKAKTIWLSYLQWGWAYSYLEHIDPKARIEFKKFPEYDFKSHQLTGRNVDFMDTLNGAYVTCDLTIDKVTKEQSLPVMDWKNDAVIHPDVMAINKAKQRCFVKCLALFGLGLSLYGLNDTKTFGKGGGNQNGHYSRSSNNNYPNNRNNRRGISSQRGSQVRSTKQPKKWVVDNIKKQLEHKTDSNPKSGKLFKSLYNNRNNLLPAIDNIAEMKHCSPAAAAYDIGKKYLDKLPDKSNKPKPRPAKSTGKAKQGSLLKNKQDKGVPLPSDTSVPF